MFDFAADFGTDVRNVSDSASYSVSVTRPQERVGLIFISHRSGVIFISHRSGVIFISHRSGVIFPRMGLPWSRVTSNLGVKSNPISCVCGLSFTCFLPVSDKNINV